MRSTKSPTSLKPSGQQTHIATSQLELKKAELEASLAKLLFERLQWKKELDEKTRRLEEQSKIINQYKADDKKNASVLNQSADKLVQAQTIIKEKDAENTRLETLLKKITDDELAKARETIIKNNKAIDDLNKKIKEEQGNSAQKMAGISSITSDHTSEIDRYTTYNSVLQNHINDLTSKHNALVADNLLLRAKIESQNQAIRKKTHWGWYALGMVGVLVGVALTATGIGAAIGAPLAVSLLSSMLATTLVPSITTILISASIALAGFLVTLKSIFNIHRNTSNDKQCQLLIDTISADMIKHPVPMKLSVPEFPSPSKRATSKPSSPKASLHATGGGLAASLFGRKDAKHTAGPNPGAATTATHRFG